MIYTLRDSSNHKMTIEQSDENQIDITVFENYDDDESIEIRFAINKTQLELLIDSLNSLNKKMK